MAFEKTAPRHDWRSKLTPEEEVEVAQLDAAIEAGRIASARINPIRNRAIQRCRYADRKPVEA